jgi:hypothetical protein
MPTTYRIVPHEGIVYLKTVGQSSFEEWRDALLGALADPAYRPGFGFPSDRRQQAAPPSADFAASITEFLKGRAGEMGRLRWATVSAVEAVYETLRAYSVIAERAGVELRVFKDIEEARWWLTSPR